MSIPTAPPVQHPHRLFIGGEWVEPSSSALFEVIDPNDEEVFYAVAEAKAADVERAIVAARHAFDEGPWPRMTHAQRALTMRAMADDLRARQDQAAVVWAREAGATRPAAQGSAADGAGILDAYAALATDFPWEEAFERTPDGGFGVLVREPVGVVGAIIPWNAPLREALLKVAPALIAGCTVVLKAAPDAPGAAYVLAEVAEAAGLPAGVLNVITAEREASEIIVRDPRVDKVSFTGSTAVGQRIGSIVGGRIGRFTLELGGKSAAVILDDADIETAAAAIAGQACVMAGQVCAALTRVIVSAHRHDEMAEALANAYSAVKVGSALDAASQMGPLVSARQRARVEDYIAKGRDQGAMLLTGGSRPAYLERGYFLEPTVFAAVDNGSIIAREEIFGPVLAVIPSADENESVRMANDSVYGLNAAVFTGDVDRARSVAARIQSGSVGMNGFRSTSSIAFGGFKQSGIGREGGREGVYPYLESKVIVLDGRPAVHPA